MITQTDSITIRTALSLAPPRHSPSVIPPIRTTNDATHPKDPQTERRLTTATDLNHLGPFEIAARLCTNGTTAPPVTGTTYPMPHPRRDGAALAVTSRARHGQSLTTVDEHITQRITPPATHTTGRWNRIASGGEQS
jgi:hypothetical protein